MSSWEARTFRPRGRRSLADRLRERYASVRAWIRMSLTVRVVALIVLGIAVVTVCDIIGRTIIAPFEMPVSVILGVVGAVVFVVLIIRQERS